MILKIMLFSEGGKIWEILVCFSIYWTFSMKILIVFRGRIWLTWGRPMRSRRAKSM